ncbi:hypothetical protein GCM10025881_31560 [Pseudolysinimonas kribbensis]|uniref:Uncharacterized protein n=1 Tax=Pseudolysinimonas kribbensis TaxID=433641 RepID=A0ABQ6KCJ6_9MICO|nr:hypothetical protein GCM10025881_31560 [Pseudolysinimonas kribbensis]
MRDWLTPHERFWRERLTRMRGVLDALPDDAQPDPAQPARHQDGDS